MILLPSHDEPGREPLKARQNLELMRVRLKKKVKTLSKVRKASVRWLLITTAQDLCRSVDKLKRQDAWVITTSKDVKNILEAASNRESQEKIAQLLPMGSDDMVALHIESKKGFEILKDICDENR